MSPARHNACVPCPPPPLGAPARRLTVPACSPGGRPLETVDLLLVCDSYLGLDQQYSVPLQPGSSGGGGGAAAPPRVGQPAQRQRRPEQQEQRRQQQGPAQQQSPPAGAQSRAPRRPRGSAGQTPQQQAETLDCHLAGAGDEYADDPREAGY